MRHWAWIHLVFLLGATLAWAACSGGNSVKSESPPTSVEQAAAHKTAAAETAEENAASEERVLDYEQSNGRVLYQRYCAVCHGKTGEGDGLNAYNLRPAVPRNFTDAEAMSKLTDDQLAQVITKGGGETGHSVLMPAWGKTLSEREVRYLISYLRFLAASTAVGESAH